MWQLRAIVAAACLLLFTTVESANFEQWKATTTSTTADLAYDGYTVDATGGSLTLTFPDIVANGGDGMIFSVKRFDNEATPTVTLASAVSGQTFDGAATFTLHVLRGIRLLAMNSKWHIVYGWDD